MNTITATLASGFRMVPVGEIGSGFVSAHPLTVGDRVAAFASSATVSEPSRYTIQVERDEHVDAAAVKYLNHSCRPNVYVDTARREVIAIRDIAAGEELSFFYPSTEWEMVEPFVCRCGHANCLGLISGAGSLDAAALAPYALNPHIRDLVDARSA